MLYCFEETNAKHNLKRFLQLIEKVLIKDQTFYFYYIPIIYILTQMSVVRGHINIDVFSFKWKVCKYDLWITDNKSEELRKEGQEYTPCTTHKTFGFKFYAALKFNSWYLCVQIKYAWRFFGILPTWFHVHQLY